MAKQSRSCELSISVINGAHCSECVCVQRTSCPDSQQEYPEDNYLMEGGIVSAFISWVERLAWLRQQPVADVCLLCILPGGHHFLFWLEEHLWVKSPEKSFLQS